jgi:hypothetical protein
VQRQKQYLGDRGLTFSLPTASVACCQLPILVLPGMDCPPVLPSRPAADRARAFLVVSSMSAWIANSAEAGRAEHALSADTDGFVFAPTAPAAQGALSTFNMECLILVKPTIAQGKATFTMKTSWCCRVTAPGTAPKLGAPKGFYGSSQV